MQESDFCRRVKKRKLKDMVRRNENCVASFSKAKLCQWFEDAESQILEDLEPQFKRKVVLPKIIKTAVRENNKHVARHGWESCNSGFDQVEFYDVQNIKKNRFLQGGFTSRNMNKSLQGQESFPVLKHDLPSRNVQPVYETQVLEKCSDSKIIHNTSVFSESQSVDEKDDDHNISLMSFPQPKSFEKYAVAQDSKGIYQDSSEISSISRMCFQRLDTNKFGSESSTDVLSIYIPEIRFEKPTSINSLQKTPVKPILVSSPQTKSLRPVSDDCSETIPLLSLCENVVQRKRINDIPTCYYKNKLDNLVPFHDAQTIPMNSTCVNDYKRIEDCTELSMPTSSQNINRKLIYCKDKNEAGFEEFKPYTHVPYFQNFINGSGSDNFHLSNFHCDSLNKLSTNFVNKDNSVILYMPPSFNCSLGFFTQKLSDQLTMKVDFNEFSKSLITSPQQNLSKKSFNNFSEKKHLSLISVFSIPSAKEEFFQQKVINTVEKEEFSDISPASENITSTEIVYATEEWNCLSCSSDSSQNELIIDQFESQCISSLGKKEGNELKDSPNVHSFDSQEELISSPLSQHITSSLSQTPPGVTSFPRGSDWLQKVSWQQKTPEKNNDQTILCTHESEKKKKKNLSGGFANKLNKLEAREKSYEAIWWYQKLHSSASVESKEKEKLMLRQTDITGKQMILELKLGTIYSKGGLIWTRCVVASNTSVISQKAALKDKENVDVFPTISNYILFLPVTLSQKLQLLHGSVIKLFSPWLQLDLACFSEPVILCSKFLDVISKLKDQAITDRKEQNTEEITLFKWSCHCRDGSVPAKYCPLYDKTCTKVQTSSEETLRLDNNLFNCQNDDIRPTQKQQ
ncbi:uncharacterized protein LOC106467060 [Limulus polyphemus]|uniref:Uncharacterized protein LOC106467060 n=1 Tax=Limulus polyphemus TaxID=6850 RepID=A0ABM1BIT0_LIMPO|nr:uncharacterized protein LOC106467060 [Limulus polyphemus]